MPKKGDRVRLNSVAAEEGVIVEVIDRGGEYLSPLFKVEWDDADLGFGVLWEYEFVVIKEVNGGKESC